jgi:hypothetical protein
VVTHASFDRRWGLGTSSTLLWNLAAWLNISPYQLLWSEFKASGYDIACAGEEGPILYRLKEGSPAIERTRFDPEFSGRIWFVYSGEKQDTVQSISGFQPTPALLESSIKKVSDITLKISGASTLEGLQAALEEHEDLMTALLQSPKIKEKFSDFNGTLKSLGAWGGDFFMAVSNGDEHYIREYFHDKGLETIFGFNEITLHPGKKPYPYS